LNCNDLNSKFRAEGLFAGGQKVSEVLRGMGIAAGILIPVVVLIVIVSMATVRRGEIEMRGGVHGSHELVPAYIPGSAGTATVAAPAAKAVKPATVAKEEISVIEILGFGTLLFVLSVLLLFGISILRHL
jgi:hypothetical protein